MTIAAPIQHLPPDPNAVTFDQVVATIEDKLDLDVSKVMRCLAAINGALQESRKYYYLPQQSTHEDVVAVMGSLLQKGALTHDIVSMLNRLLLNRTRGEECLIFQDWTGFDNKPCIAIIIMLNY